MGERLYPLTFEPVLRDYMWGGRRLERLFGRALPPGITAESWEVSAHPSSPTAVAHGPLRGLTLPEVVERLGADLLGANVAPSANGSGFPLLVKLLDANLRLSVQVHPDDAYALSHGGDLGKTEMWYVLYAAPGAGIIYGLQEGVTREEFARAVSEGALDRVLRHVTVRAGDAICVPAGTVHALLSGLVVAEIQENSDTTYRVYDWDWDCNCRAGLLAYPEVTLAGMAVTPGEVLRLPDSGYDIGGGFEALVLYAAEDRITLKYTCEDNVVWGYTIHVEGVCVEPRLLALYREWNAAGRGRLPALRGLQPFGRAMGGEVGVAIRDTGTFMDPRARQSWWEARWAPARVVD